MNVIASENEVLEAFYNGVSPVKLTVASNIRNDYNKVCGQLNIDTFLEQGINTNKWFLPPEFENLDIVDFYLSKNLSEIEQQRVLTEINLFIISGNEQLLKFLIYLGSLINNKNNGIITGVGRGSAVSLLTLYLCGVTKINPLKYDLDYKDFFKITEE